MKPGRSLLILGVAVALSSAACGGGAECGPGTSENDDGDCVASCGAGTELRGGECVVLRGNGSEGLNCGPTTELNEDGTACVLSEASCAPPTMLDRETGLCVAPGQVSCGAGTVESNGVCIPSCEGPLEIQNQNSNGCVPAARIQVVHASPDPALATVDVYSGANLLETEAGEVVGDDFAFRSATPVIKVPLRQPLRVTASDSQSSEDFLLELSADELSQARFLVVVRPAADGTSAELVAFDRLVDDSVGLSGVRFSFVNASVGSSLSVGRQERYGVAAAEELFSNVAVDVLPPYVEVPSGTRAFDVYEAGGGVPLASVQTSSGDVIPAASGLAEGDAGVLVALGVQAPAGGQTALDFLWVLADGRVGPADRAARLQLVHGSFEAGTGVDVYLSASEDSELGEPIAADLLYQQATPFQSFVAGVPGVVRLVGNTSEPTPENVVSSTPVSFAFGQTARVVALGGSADSPLTVNVVESSEQAADPATIDIQMFHASTTAPSPVDVYLSSAAPGAPGIDFANPDVAGLTFGVATPAVEGRAFEDTFVSLSEDGASVAVNFNAPIETVWFAGRAGESFFALVSGSAEAAVTDLDLTMFSPAGGSGAETADGTAP